MAMNGDSAEMDPAQEIEVMRGEIARLLQGIDRYNPTHVRKWEKYVELQAQTGIYDFDANLAVLKLYQFNPSYFQVPIATTILLKAMMNLPAMDFHMCKSVTPEHWHKDENISNVMYLADLLETCYFKRFWDELATFRELVGTVTGFQDAIVKYVCQVVSITFQTIREAHLADLLPKDANLDKIMETQGWQRVADGNVLISNKEQLLSKPKKVVEQLEMDTVLPVLGKVPR